MDLQQEQENTTANGSSISVDEADQVATSPSKFFCKPRIRKTDNKCAKFLLVPEREIYFVAVLGVAYEVTNYILLVLVTLLTRYGGMTIEQAAMTTNIQEGSQSTLIVILACLSDCYLGRSIALICAALSLLLGMLLLGYTLPPKGSDYVPLPGVLLLGVVLVTIGQCGYVIYKTKWEQETIKNRIMEEWNNRHPQAGGLSNNSGQEQQEIPSSLYERVLQHLKNWFRYQFIETNWIRAVGLLVAVFILPSAEGIAAHSGVNYGLPLVLLLSGTVIFTYGKITYYGFEKPQGSVFAHVLRVIYVAGKRLLFRRANNNQHESYYFNDHSDNHTRQLNQTADNDNNGDHQHLEPGLSSSTNVVNDNNQSSDARSHFTDSLRWLDKAALYDSSAEMPPEELYKKGKICTVEEVEKTKRFLRVYLLSSTFLMYGIMTAVGSTFFVLQADQMNTYILSIKVPIELFVLSSSLVRMLVSTLCEWVVGDEPHEQSLYTSRHGFYGAIRVLSGMLLSIPCFMIASVIEAKRLGAVKKRIRITAYWTLPQFFLLGAIDGLAVNGMEYFFKKEMPRDLEPYLDFLAEGATGLGKLLSVMFLPLADNLSQRGGRRGWFGDFLDDSRLDKYYKLMAIFGVVCCVFHASLVAYTSGACCRLRSFIKSSSIA